MPKAKLAITKELCESKPAKCVKAYDKKCPGFFVSVTPKGKATFYFRYWSKPHNKQLTVHLGVYHPDLFPIDDARTKAKELSGRVGRGEDIAREAQQSKQEEAASTLTVTALIDLYLDSISAEEMKPWGKMAPRVETWSHYRGFLNRFTRTTKSRTIFDRCEGWPSTIR